MYTYPQGFYQPYQPLQMQPQPIAQPTVPPRQQAGGIVFVDGEEGARSYPVGRGMTVPLFDSTAGSDLLYVKSCDQLGREEITTYTLGEVVDEGGPDYVTREELRDAIRDELGRQVGQDAAKRDARKGERA